MKLSLKLTKKRKDYFNELFPELLLLLPPKKTVFDLSHEGGG